MTLGVCPVVLKSIILSKDMDVEFNKFSASLMKAWNHEKSCSEVLSTVFAQYATK